MLLAIRSFHCVLHLTAQHVSAEEIMRNEEQLSSEYSLLRGSKSLSVNEKIFFILEIFIRFNSAFSLIRVPFFDFNAKVQKLFCSCKFFLQKDTHLTLQMKQNKIQVRLK